MELLQDSTSSISRSSSLKKLLHTSLSQCSPSIPLNELINAINDIVSNPGSPSEFLPKLHPLFRETIKAIYHSSYESNQDVLSAVSTIMIYIVEEVLPAFWDKNLKEKEHFRGENWGFKSDKVGDGRAWDSLLQSMLAGILDHLERSVEIDEKGRELKDQKNRTVVCETTYKALSLIISDPNSWRIPLETHFYAFDIILDSISKHLPNKTLIRSAIPAATLSQIFHKGYDRILSEKALELAYRNMPPIVNKDKTEKDAWITGLFPNKSSGDAKVLREKFEKIVATDYYSTVAQILNPLAGNLLSRAQPFETSKVNYNNLSLVSLDGEDTLVEWAIGRDIVCAKVDEGDEEVKFWFGLETVEKADLALEGEEAIVTFTLNSAASFMHAKISNSSINNTVTFRSLASKHLNVLKKTLKDRARLYPALIIINSVSLPSSSGLVPFKNNNFATNTTNTNSNPTTTTTTRRASHAGPILASQPKQGIDVPNSDDVYPSNQRVSNRSNNNSNGKNQLNLTDNNIKQRSAVVLAGINEDESRSVSENGTKSSRNSKDSNKSGKELKEGKKQSVKITRTILQPEEVQEILAAEVVADQVLNIDSKSKGKGKGKGTEVDSERVETKQTPAFSRTEEQLKKTPIDTVQFEQPRKVDAPKIPNNILSHEQQLVQNPTPSQKMEVVIDPEESELSDLEGGDEDENDNLLPTVGTIILESSPYIQPQPQSKPTIKSKNNKSVVDNKESSFTNSRQRQTRNSAASRGDEFFSVEASIELSESNPPAKNQLKSKKVIAEKVTTTVAKNKRKSEVVVSGGEESIPQTRSRAVVEVDQNISADNGVVDKVAQVQSPVVDEMEEDDQKIPIQSAVPLPAKRRRLHDPSPIDPNAATATTLMVSDKSATVTASLENKRNLVSPKRTYGKEKKERKMAERPKASSKGKGKEKMNAVEEEEVEEEEEEEIVEVEADAADKEPDSIIVDEVQSSRGEDEIEEFTAPEVQSKITSNKASLKNVQSRASDIIVPSKTAPRISALKKSVDVESQKVITATNTAATGSSKSNNKRIERASKSGVQSKKAINSFTELVAEPLLIPPSRQNPRSTSKPMSDNESPPNEVNDDEINPREIPRVAVVDQQPDEVSAATLGIPKEIARSHIKVVNDQQLDSRRNSKVSNDSDTRTTTSEIIRRNESGKAKSREVSKNLQNSNVEASEVTRPNVKTSTSKAPTLAPPRNNNNNNNSIGSTSRQTFLYPKETAPNFPENLNDNIPRISHNSSKTISRSSGSKSKSKNSNLPTTKERAQVVNMEERMDIDEDDEESDVAEVDEDAEMQSVLSDIVKIVAAKSRDRSKRQVDSFNNSVDKLNKKAAGYMNEIHNDTGEIIQTLHTHIQDRDKKTASIKQNLERIKAASKVRLAQFL